MPRVVGTRGRTRTVGWSGRLTSVTHDMLTTGGERRRNASNTYASETRPPQARRPVSGAAGPIFRWKKPQTPLGAHPLRGTHDPPEPRAATSIKRHHAKLGPYKNPNTCIVISDIDIQRIFLFGQDSDTTQRQHCGLFSTTTRPVQPRSPLTYLAPVVFQRTNRPTLSERHTLVSERTDGRGPRAADGAYLTGFSNHEANRHPGMPMYPRGQEASASLGLSTSIGKASEGGRRSFDQLQGERPPGRRLKTTEDHRAIRESLRHLREMACDRTARLATKAYDAEDRSAFQEFWPKCLERARMTRAFVNADRVD